MEQTAKNRLAPDDVQTDGAESQPSLYLDLKALQEKCPGNAFTPGRVLQVLDRHWRAGPTKFCARFSTSERKAHELLATLAKEQRLKPVRTSPPTADRAYVKILADPLLLEGLLPAFNLAHTPSQFEGLADLLSLSNSPGRLLGAWRHLARSYPLPELEDALIKASRALVKQAENKADAEGEDESTASIKNKDIEQGQTGKGTFSTFDSYELCRPIVNLLQQGSIYPALLAAATEKMPLNPMADKVRRGEPVDDVPAEASRTTSAQPIPEEQKELLLFVPVHFEAFCRHLQLDPNSKLGRRLCTDLALQSSALSLKNSSAYWLPAMAKAPADKLAAMLTKLAAATSIPSGSRAQLCRDLVAPLEQDREQKALLDRLLPPTDRRNIRRQISLFNVREHFSANPVKYHFFMGIFNHILQAVKADGATLILRFRDFYLVDCLDRPDRALLWSQTLFDRQVKLQSASQHVARPPFPARNLTTAESTASTGPLEGLLEVSFVEPDYSLTRAWFANHLGQGTGLSSRAKEALRPD